MTRPHHAKSTIETLAVFNNGGLWKHQGRYHYDSSYYRFLEELGRHFREVSVLAPVSEEPPTPGLPALDTQSVGVIELPWYSNIETSFKAMTRYLRKPGRWRNDLRGVDAILLMDYFFPFFWLFYLLAKLNRVQVIQCLRAHDPAIIRSGKYPFLVKIPAVVLSEAGFRLLRLLSRRTPTLVVGEELHEIFSRSSPLVRAISPSSVSIRDLAPSAGERFDRGELRLLYVGRLQRAKGLEDLIKAIREVADAGNRIELSIVGEDARGGSYLQQLREQVTRSGMDEVVRFHGHVPFGERLMSFYRDSDVFVLPSLSEGRPKVLYEAMIAGMAIIATRVGGIPEVIEDGVSGLLVDPGDVDGLTALLNRACQDRAMLRRLSEMAGRRAPEFTLERSAEHAAEMIHQVVLSHRR
jgi:glycosyltransferase involved in cell wall biosynthesis